MLRACGAAQVVVDMVKNRLAEPDAQEHGWLLDGYPRSAEQAEAIEAENIRPDIFILINVSAVGIVNRSADSFASYLSLQNDIRC